ncbi:16S rRNA (cytosine967-C5)-methyltransferase [Caminicella sporogenes DSM 14501]|uniref:16S rRNA (cytosine(967)-C(5))-methyltransferase n=1 Tax=Caminicella sporogenes DSM 14501 TaxID=1121266 RepID=A0A1M6LHR1_9FIRM|nr:16S rRNA (cytosine(967)-C(5))-methyltransferase RsmB [Caminicella sporogenes]RKD27835.1 16S rRNA (cytosine(967)-C(5))-methyltransferase [Caminicella sporogenes]SHJ70707.1 16S rRNA (cytosine967-C5)-methyltransferase [Caminicella sporogenes DSM 14501]
MEKVNARKIALKILSDIEENGAYSNIAINKTLKTKDISTLDRRFISQLVYGVLENKLYLDFIIKNFSKTKIKKIHVDILNILRLGLYQIIYLDKVPNSAAVNESVKLAKKVNFRLAGYVNGILRNYLRNSNSLKLPNFKEKPIEFLSLKYSHPMWIIENWIDNFGIEFTEKLLKANNDVPNLTIRTNKLKITRDELLNVLAEENVKCIKGQYVDESIIIKNFNTSIENLNSFKEGLFQVQDEASMLAGLILNPKENDFVIDVCSAPGGKSTHIAELMQNRGKVLSRDIHEHKLILINQNAKRLGISIIETEIYDALKLDKSLIGKADKVLVDAPCSGFGIIRRKPEIKYLKNLEDIKKLSEIQYKILLNASQYVKKEGFLVYCTCTIQPDENIEVINRFLKDNDSFVMDNVNKYLPNSLQTDKNYLQLFPHLHGIDGFFICKLKRIK